MKTHPDQIHISLVNQEKTKSESENTSNQKVKVKTHPDQIPISLVNQEITKSKSENKSNEKKWKWKHSQTKYTSVLSIKNNSDEESENKSDQCPSVWLQYYTDYNNWFASLLSCFCFCYCSTSVMQIIAKNWFASLLYCYCPGCKSLPIIDLRFCYIVIVRDANVWCSQFESWTGSRASLKQCSAVLRVNRLKGCLILSK